MQSLKRIFGITTVHDTFYHSFRYFIGFHILFSVKEPEILIFIIGNRIETTVIPYKRNNTIGSGSTCHIFHIVLSGSYLFSFIANRTVNGSHSSIFSHYHRITFIHPVRFYFSEKAVYIIFLFAGLLFIVLDIILSPKINTFRIIGKIHI